MEQFMSDKLVKNQKKDGTMVMDTKIVQDFIQQYVVMAGMLLSI